MVDPVSAAGTGLTVADAIVKAVAHARAGRQTRAELLKALGGDHLHPSVRDVLGEWINDERVHGLLRDDPEQAREGLELRFQQAGVTPDLDLGDLLTAGRGAALDQRPAAQAVREEAERTRAELRAGLSAVTAAIDAGATVAATPEERLNPSVEWWLAQDDAIVAQVRGLLQADPRTSAAGIRLAMGPSGPLHEAGFGAWAAAAHTAEARGHEELAVELWQGAVDRAPNPDDIKPRLALALHSSGRQDDAFAVASQAAEQSAAALALVVPLALREDWEAMALLPRPPTTGAPNDVTAALLLGRAFEELERHDEALEIARSLADQPGSVAAREAHAALLLGRVSAGNSVDTTADLNLAQREAEAALRSRVEYGFQLGRAPSLAVAAAFEANDSDAVRRIVTYLRERGLDPQFGSRAAAAVAIVHAGDGDLDRLPGMTPALRGWVGAFISREEHRDQDLVIAELVELYAEDGDLSHRVRVLLLLADHDAVPEELLTDLAGDEPGAAAAVRARVHACRGEPELAVQYARLAADSEAMTGQVLATTYAELGHFEALLDTAEREWADVRDVQLVGYALHVTSARLGDAAHRPALDRAVALGQRARLHPNLTPAQRHRLLRALLEAQMAAQRWADAVETIRRLLTAATVGAREGRALRWGLIQCLINVGRPRLGWAEAVTTNGSLLEPLRPDQVPTLTELVVRYSDDAAHLGEVLRLVDVADEVHAGAALGSILHRTAQSELSESTSALLRDLIDAYSTAHPESAIFRRINIDELRDFLEERGQHEVPTMSERDRGLVFAGLAYPFRLLAAARGTYARVILGSLQHVHAAGPSLLTRQRDAANAARAMDERVVFDLTAVATLARLDVALLDAGVEPLASRIIAELHEPVTPAHVALDVEETVADLRSRMDVAEADDPTVRAALHMVYLCDMLGRAATDTVEDQRASVAAAFAALESARSTDEVLVLDHGMLRRDLGSLVASTSVPALVEALHAAGRLSHDDREAARAAFLATGVSVLPTSGPAFLEAVTASLAEGSHVGLPTIASPGWWGQRRNLTRDAFQLMEAIAEGDGNAPDPAWMRAAFIGIGVGLDLNAAARTLFLMVHFGDGSVESVQPVTEAWRAAVTLVSGEGPTIDGLEAVAAELLGEGFPIPTPGQLDSVRQSLRLSAR